MTLLMAVLRLQKPPFTVRRCTDRRERRGGRECDLRINGGAIIESAYAYTPIMAGQFGGCQMGVSHLLSYLRSHQKKKRTSQHLGWDTKCQKNVRLINLKRHIDYFSKGPKSSRTDRTQKRRSFRVNSILSFCHYVKHETQHVGQLISIKRHTI